MWVGVFVYVCVYRWVCVFVYVYVCICWYVCLCIYVCIGVFVYVCVCECAVSPGQLPQYCITLCIVWVLIGTYVQQTHHNHHTPHTTRHTPHTTHHTRHTPHATHHTSHATHHTPHATHHTPHTHTPRTTHTTHYYWLISGSYTATIACCYASNVWGCSSLFVLKYLLDGLPWSDHNVVVSM